MSWNIAKKHEPWRELLQMDADVALLQEASPPPDDVVQLRDADTPARGGRQPPGHRPARSVGLAFVELRLVAWELATRCIDRWPMVVRLSDRVDVEWFKQVGPIAWPKQDEIAVSGIGTIAAARITPARRLD